MHAANYSHKRAISHGEMNHKNWNSHLLLCAMLYLTNIGEVGTGAALLPSTKERHSCSQHEGSVHLCTKNSGETVLKFKLQHPGTAGKQKNV